MSGRVLPQDEGVAARRLVLSSDEDRRRVRTRRAFWLKQLYAWHWISSALCLVGMLLFAATGITLNHAAQVEARARVATREAALPASLLSLVQALISPHEVARVEC